MKRILVICGTWKAMTILGWTYHLVTTQLSWTHDHNISTNGLLWPLIFLTSGCHDAQHFYKRASSIHTFSTKNEAFGWTNSQTCNICKQWETSTTHSHAVSAMCAWGVNVDTHFRDTFSISPIQLKMTSL